MTHPYIRRIAEEAADGKWGNGYTRYLKIRQAGFDYNAIQREVSRIMARRNND